jgi:shikimate dehydrogenase
MRLFGLIGFPLTHSFSKNYFTEKFEKEKLKDCRYELFPIFPIVELRKIVKENPSLKGLNVTIPYKESVLEFLNDSNELVKQIGASNCIKIEGGKMIGYNTDVFGFEKSLDSKLRPHHRNALILGTGGSSKAVAFVLEKKGIPYKKVSRKPATGHFSYQQLTPVLVKENLLIINTTPVGMFPNTTAAPLLPYEAISEEHFLFDLVYNPAKTLFLKKGEEKGAVIQNGSDMLIYQAEESWRIWNS